METISTDRRKQILAGAVATQLARNGHWRIEIQTDTYAIVVKGKPTNHILHLLLTVFTAGIWAIVWIILAVTGGETRFKLAVDEYGNGTVERLN